MNMRTRCRYGWRLNINVAWVIASDDNAASASNDIVIADGDAAAVVFFCCHLRTVYNID